jgi:hypothetical protein
MFIGFIAIIVVLLVIVAVMSISGTNTGSGGVYQAESKKVLATISNLAAAEAPFYYVKNNETFKDITMSYFNEVGFQTELMGNTVSDGAPMLATEWLGLTSDYNGHYLMFGGPASDNLRLVITNKGDDDEVMLLLILGRDIDGDGNVDNVDEAYLSSIEKTLETDIAFIGN